MKKILTTFFFIALTAAVLSAGNDSATNTFIETYDDGRASRRVFNREFPARTRSTVSTRAIGLLSALPA